LNFAHKNQKTRLKKTNKTSSMPVNCFDFLLVFWFIYFIDFFILNVQTRTKHTHTHTDRPPFIFFYFFVVLLFVEGKKESNRDVRLAVVDNNWAHDTIAFVHIFPFVFHTQKAWKSCLSLFYFICSTQFFCLVLFLEHFKQPNQKLKNNNNNTSQFSRMHFLLFSSGKIP
jgi:hypothetical protein